MINPHYFLDENLKNRFKINLESHNINHANSLIRVTSDFPEFRIETRYINKFLKNLATIHARLINQYKFKHLISFSASLYKIIEDDQRGDETELFNNLNTNHNLTENDIKNIDVKSQLERQNQIQDSMESGWIFDKFSSMKIGFYKTSELNGSSYVKIPLRSNALMNSKIYNKYCFFRSILAYLPPCENYHPNRVSNYKQYFDKLNIEGFDLVNGYKCSDVHNFQKLKSVYITIFELNSYQDQNKWKH